MRKKNGLFELVAYLTTNVNPDVKGANGINNKNGLKLKNNQAVGRIQDVEGKIVVDFLVTFVSR